MLTCASVRLCICASVHACIIQYLMIVCILCVYHVCTHVYTSAARLIPGVGCIKPPGTSPCALLLRALRQLISESEIGFPGCPREYYGDALRGILSGEFNILVIYLYSTHAIYYLYVYISMHTCHLSMTIDLLYPSICLSIRPCIPACIRMCARGTRRVACSRDGTAACARDPSRVPFSTPSQGGWRSRWSARAGRSSGRSCGSTERSCRRQRPRRFTFMRCGFTLLMYISFRYFICICCFFRQLAA